MAIEFTKLSEVEQVEAVSDDATVLVEEDGEIKRVSANVLGSQQPDWEQNDPTKSDYIKNRPFYSTMGVVEILPEQSVTKQREQNGVYMGELDFSYNVGENYNVKINGKEYSVTAKESENGAYLGDLLPGGDSEPFTIYEYMPGVKAIAWSASFGETITLAIYEEQEVVKKLDPKFVGGATLYVPEDSQFLYKDASYTEGLTTAELNSLSLTNIVIMLGGAEYVPIRRENDVLYIYVDSTESLALYPIDLLPS